MRKQWVFFILLLVMFQLATAQKKRLRLSAGSGIGYYLGDLTVSNLPQKKRTHPFLYLAANYQITSVLSTGIGFFSGRVSAADSLTSRKNVRDLHFRSSINDLHLLMSIDVRQIWLHFKSDDGIRERFDLINLLEGPKIVLGGGVFHYNPKGYYDGKWHTLQKLGTEGQLIEGEGYPEPYKRLKFNVKVGGEIGFRVNPQWQIDVFGFYNILFTDYLDDVSGSYPDYNELLASKNGELASVFTYGNDETPPSNVAGRGNPDNNDSYINMGIKLTYTISRSQLNRMGIK